MAHDHTAIEEFCDHKGVVVACSVWISEKLFMTNFCASGVVSFLLGVSVP